MHALAAGLPCADETPPVVETVIRSNKSPGVPIATLGRLNAEIGGVYDATNRTYTRVHASTCGSHQWPPRRGRRHASRPRGLSVRLRGTGGADVDGSRSVLAVVNMPR
jgi:hypothetical protein